MCRYNIKSIYKHISTVFCLSTLFSQALFLFKCRKAPIIYIFLYFKVNYCIMDQHVQSSKCQGSKEFVVAYMEDFSCPHKNQLTHVTKTEPFQCWAQVKCQWAFYIYCMLYVTYTCMTCIHIYVYIYGKNYIVQNILFIIILYMSKMQYMFSFCLNLIK